MQTEREGRRKKRDKMARRSAREEIIYWVLSSF
jgi:hypothetical protein